MENERKKKFQDYAPPEQKPSGGYNLNGVYYSRDGQRLDDQPKKSWSQREYERAEREKIHCRAKREQGESEVDAQGNPVKDNSGVKKAIAIVVIVLGVVAIFGIVGIYLKSDNGTVGLIREAIQTIRDDDSSHTSENSHKAMYNSPEALYHTRMSSWQRLNFLRLYTDYAVPCGYCPGNKRLRLFP